MRMLRLCQRHGRGFFEHLVSLQPLEPSYDTCSHSSAAAAYREQPEFDNDLVELLDRTMCRAPTGLHLTWLEWVCGRCGCCARPNHALLNGVTLGDDYARGGCAWERGWICAPALERLPALRAPVSSPLNSWFFVQGLPDIVSEPNYID